MKARGMKRDFIPGVIPYHGTQWWSLTRECAEFVLKQADSNLELNNFYRYTKFPDEQFFQTIIMNSKYAGNVVNNNLRFIDWSNVNMNVADWITNPPHPKTLTVQDFYRLKHSPALFRAKV